MDRARFEPKVKRSAVRPKWLDTDNIQETTEVPSTETVSEKSTENGKNLSSKTMTS